MAVNVTVDNGDDVSDDNGDDVSDDNGDGDDDDHSINTIEFLAELNF